MRSVPLVAERIGLSLPNMTIHLSTEEKLLLRCAKVELGPDDTRVVEDLLKGQVDWAALLETARWHRLSGPLFHHLRGSPCSELVPLPVLSQLRGTYHYNIARYMCQRAELQRLLDALSSRGIAVIVLKGAALQELVYPNPGLRPKNDIDILVRDKDLDTTYQLIVQMGYSPQCSEETEQRTRSDHRHLPLLVGADKPVWFEVHRHITREDSPLHFDISDFWAKARQVNIAGNNALTLTPEHMLIHLCVHFFLDRQYRTVAALGQLCDIAETIRHYLDGLDWTGFTLRVRLYGIEGVIYYVLHAARRLLDAAVPEAVLVELRPEHYDEEATDLFLRHRVLEARDFLAHGLVSPRTSYHVGTAVGSMLRRLVPDKVALAEKHGLDPASKRLYLYYLVRWWKAMGGIARSVVNPSQLRTELTLDRWMHSVFSRAGNGAGTSSREST